MWRERVKIDHQEVSSHSNRWHWGSLKSDKPVTLTVVHAKEYVTKFQEWIDIFAGIMISSHIFDWCQVICKAYSLLKWSWTFDQFTNQLELHQKGFLYEPQKSLEQTRLLMMQINRLRACMILKQSLAFLPTMLLAENCDRFNIFYFQHWKLWEFSQKHHPDDTQSMIENLFFQTNWSIAFRMKFEFQSMFKRIWEISGCTKQWWS